VGTVTTTTSKKYVHKLIGILHVCHLNLVSPHFTEVIAPPDLHLNGYLLRHCSLVRHFPLAWGRLIVTTALMCNIINTIAISIPVLRCIVANFPWSACYYTFFTISQWKQWNSMLIGQSWVLVQMVGMVC